MSRLLIQFSKLNKSFQSIALFEEITLSVNEGDRFALIGKNGTGKTTLLKILAGIIAPDTGMLSGFSDLTICYLPQEISIAPSIQNVRSYLEDSRFSKLEQQMSECLEDPERLTEWEQHHEAYVRLGGYQRVPVEKVLNGLKLEKDLLECPVSVLSSGQKVRIALAKVLLENPDLLLLDEPTNHLDVEMLDWLKQTLVERQGATVIVSHDRKFLNEACNHLIEISDRKLTRYGGSYDFYLEEKERLLKRQIRAYKEQKEKRAQLKQKIKKITFSKKKAPPAKDSNVMAYDKRGEHHQKSIQRNLDFLKSELEEIESNPLSNPNPRGILGLKFASNPLATSVALELHDIEKSLGEKLIFTHLNKTVHRDDRLIITGPNGCGKTTLLKCIAGLLPTDRGTVRLTPSTHIAYLDQEVDLLPMESTPLHYFENQYHLTEEEIRRELHKTAIGGAEHLHLPFSRLSVGQRKRLMLLSLLLEKPNVLLLDEPTNHLDFSTLEALEKALLTFDGAVIAVSHDETFIKKIGTQIWDFQKS